MRELEDGCFPALRGHPLQRVAGGIAYRAIRNRGTIGGSLAHADPAADWPVVLAALGARSGPAFRRAATRRLGVADFMLGAYTTVLAADEIVAAVRRAALAPTSRWGYYKFCRKTGEFAEASCAALLDPVDAARRALPSARSTAPPAAAGRWLQRSPGRACRAAGRDALLAAVRAAAAAAGMRSIIRLFTQRGRALPGAGAGRWRRVA